MSAPEPNAFKKVIKGDNIRIPAEAYNAFIDAALAHRSSTRNFIAGGIADVEQDTAWVQVRNTGSDLSEYTTGAIKQSTIPIDPSDDEDFDEDNEAEFVLQQAVDVEAVSDVTLPFVWFPEPILANEFGRGLVHGVCVTQFVLNDLTHKFLVPRTGYSIPQTAATGPIRLLWREQVTPASGQTIWGIALIGQPLPTATTNTSMGTVTSIGKDGNGYYDGLLTVYNGTWTDTATAIKIYPVVGELLTRYDHYPIQYLNYTVSSVQVWATKANVPARKKTLPSTYTDYNKASLYTFEHDSGFRLAEPTAGELYVTLASASVSEWGVVNTTTQTFSGAKRLEHPSGSYHTIWGPAGSALVFDGINPGDLAASIVGYKAGGSGAIMYVTAEGTGGFDPCQLELITGGSGVPPRVRLNAIASATYQPRFEVFEDASNAIREGKTGNIGLGALAVGGIVTDLGSGGSAPSTASSTGTTGTMATDGSFLYVCTGTNTWKRVAIATW